MTAISSTELDDAIFPQPPHDVQDVAGGEPQEILMIPQDEPKWEENRVESFDELDEDKDDDKDEGDKKGKKKLEKKKSRIRRLFTGMRLKKGDSETSSGDDGEKTESNISLRSREESLVEGDPENQTALTRIIHRVQNKANRMWEHLGQKLGGKADSEEEEEGDQEQSSKLTCLADMRADDIQHQDLEINKVEVSSEDLRSSLKDELQELSSEDTSGKGKSGTLRRLASGLKSGLLPKNVKNKN